MRWIALLLAFIVAPVLAQDAWTNGDDWCCGIADCGLVGPGAVHAAAGGYLINGPVVYFREPARGTGNKLGPFDHSEWVREVVPYSEARPAHDGAYWRCRRPDGTRRCFFAPKPGS